MDFKQFFTNFTSPESIAILILWVLAFLLGILLGSVLRGRTVRRVRRDLELKQEEVTTLQTEITRLTNELHLREADLRKTQFEAEEHKSKVNRLADEKTKLYNEVYSLNGEVEKLRQTNTSASPVVTELNATIERLNGNIATLQSENEALRAELAQLKMAPAAPVIPDPQEETIDYLAEFQSTQNALRARLEALEGKIGNLESENSSLRTEMQSLRTVTPASQPAVMERSMPLPSETIEPEPTWNLGTRQAPILPQLETSTIAKDDLTRIDGIGPFLEKQLNDIGIYTFEQMSRWDGADIHNITQQIRYFPGRIEREDWVGQAVRFMQPQPESEPVPMETYSSNINAAYPADHTDLTIIEGIGPKIESLLREAGLNTWDDLAEADLDQLHSLLDANNLSFHNPATWTAQARLAAGGHWELLKEYQEQLKGGKDVS